MEHSNEIFGNKMPAKVVKKAASGQAKLLRKFGDDRGSVYHLSVDENPVLADLGTGLLVSSDTPLTALPENPVLIGNIRMGFGHYRISMAMCRAAKALGCTPLWFDLNSFGETTGGKIIRHQNDLYSLGSRLSQRSGLFNRAVWEPMNSEGFRKLSYNAADQKNAELMTPIFGDLPRNIPLVATHVWPAQAAVHAGMQRVVNAIPDDWQMGLHLAEGAIHTVQTPSAFLGYKTLRGMEKNAVLQPIPEGQLVQTGHYIDHELVQNLNEDCDRRIARAVTGAPLRWLLTIGGAGAQKELYVAILKELVPLAQQGKAVILMNAGDHKDVLMELCREVPGLEQGMMHTAYSDIKALAAQALTGEVQGIHLFYSEDIYTAVYATNLLMRASDVLVTKPSELAFYPVPKLLIRRVGGHEAWGAICAAELGDGTYECQTVPETMQMLRLLNQERSILAAMCTAIKKQNQIGTYHGAYEVIQLALGKA